MKKLMMICGLVLGVITFTNAQDKVRQMPTAEDRAKKSTERLAEKLSLSDAQKAKVLAVYTEQGKTREKESAEVRKEMAAKKADRMKEMAKNEAKINDILTADQKKAYEAMKAERKAKMSKRGERSKGEYKERMHKGTRTNKTL